MGKTNDFEAQVTIRDGDPGHLVADRVARHHDTTQLIDRSIDPNNAESTSRFRRLFLHSLRNGLYQLIAECGGMDIEEEKATINLMMERFTQLTDTLERSQAVALPAGFLHMDILESVMCPILNKGQGRSLSDETERLIYAGVINPLLVAVLAYALGGPINSSFTASGRKWQPSSEADDHSYAEGGIMSIFDNFCLTLVWEVGADGVQKLAGEHSVHVSGSTSAHRLPILQRFNGVCDGPVFILYNSKDAALTYRNLNSIDPPIHYNISMDFHLVDHDNHDVHLFPLAPGTDLTSIPLVNLVTETQIPQYSAHFFRQLTKPENIRPMLEMLSDLNTNVPTELRQPIKPALQQRFEAYQKDNKSSMPRRLKKMADERIKGRHMNTRSFIEVLCLKAQRDLHSSLGANLFPQTPLEEDWEYARKHFRGLPNKSWGIEAAFSRYSEKLVQPYTSHHIMTTEDLQRYATKIEQQALFLLSRGFVDKPSGAGKAPARKPGILTSVPSFVSALGKAINGPKQREMAPEPYIQPEDMLVYRTRCLYLFFCCNYLVEYLSSPQGGPLMLLDPRDKRIQGLLGANMQEAEDVACLLLRNWVAWGLLMDELPQSVFRVRFGTVKK